MPPMQKPPFQRTSAELFGPLLGSPKFDRRSREQCFLCHEPHEIFPFGAFEALFESDTMGMSSSNVCSLFFLGVAELSLSKCWPCLGSQPFLGILQRNSFGWLPEKNRWSPILAPGWMPMALMPPGLS